MRKGAVRGECWDRLQLNMEHAGPGSQRKWQERMSFSLCFLVLKYSSLKVSFYATKEIFSDQIWNSYLKIPNI